MMIMAAGSGLGLGALVVAAIAFGWYTVRNDRFAGWTGQVLLALGTLLGLLPGMGMGLAGAWRRVRDRHRRPRAFILWIVPTAQGTGDPATSANECAVERILYHVRWGFPRPVSGHQPEQPGPDLGRISLSRLALAASGKQSPGKRAVRPLGAFFPGHRSGHRHVVGAGDLDRRDRAGIPKRRPTGRHCHRLAHLLYGLAPLCSLTVAGMALGSYSGRRVRLRPADPARGIVVREYTADLKYSPIAAQAL